MLRARYSLCVAFTALATLAAAGPDLELQGRLKPAPGRASVTLHGADAPFTATTFSDSKGRFRFKRLKPGAYTVIAFIPGLGEVRRTVVVSPSLADSKGRVAVTVPFSPSGSTSAKTLEQHNTVSVRQLRIPDRARKEYERAQKKLNSRDVEGAILHLERALELAPHFMGAWNNLGVIAYQRRELEKAEGYFRKALEQEPGAFDPVVNLGGTLLSLGRHTEALKYNQYALSERPDDPLANSQMGQNYFFLGDEEKALKHLNAAKSADPAHFSRPQLVLAQIYLRRGEQGKAVRELEDFLARHPDAANAEKVRQQLELLRRPEER